MIRCSRRRSRQADAGYNLVALMVMVTVMNAMVAIALPMWSHIMRRDAEEELIFRGLQYAEAIRVFQTRFQRLPVRLEELIEVEPRSIRQLWDNPLAENGRWKPIFQNAGQPGSRPGQRPGQGAQGGRPDRQQNPGGNRGGGGRGAERGFSQVFDDGDQSEGADGETVRVGPITGVFSPVGGEAIKTWNGSREIASWQFTVELLTGGGNNQAFNAGHIGGVNKPGGQVPQIVNADNLGRPFPPGVVPPGVGAGGAGAGGAGAVAGGQGPVKGGQDLGGSAGSAGSGGGRGGG